MVHRYKGGKIMEEIWVVPILQKWKVFLSSVWFNALPTGNKRSRSNHDQNPCLFYSKVSETVQLLFRDNEWANMI